MITDISATIVSRPTGVTADHLIKVWSIDAKSADQSLDVTTQLLHCSDDPTFSCKYSNGDRMLCYKQIYQYLFMDTFFAHTKKGESSRGYTCMPLFLTDK